MSVSSIGPQNDPYQTQKASASAQSAGATDADDVTTKPGQAPVAKADADDKAVNSNALSTSSSSVQAALLNLQPGGAYST